MIAKAPALYLIYSRLHCLLLNIYLVWPMCVCLIIFAHWCSELRYSFAGLKFMLYVISFLADLYLNSQSYSSKRLRKIEGLAYKSPECICLSVYLILFSLCVCLLFIFISVSLNCYFCTCVCLSICLFLYHHNVSLILS